MKASEKKIKKSEEVESRLVHLAKEKPPTSTKDLFIDSATGIGEEVLKRFLPIVEMVVKKEYKTIPSYLAEYSELINIGLMTVNKLLYEVNETKKKYNSSYIAQAVKWAIKDELRSKYNWYGVKQAQAKDSIQDEYDPGVNPREITGEDEVHVLNEEEAAGKIFETILYLEDLPRETISKEQMTSDELARLELLELKAAVRRAIDKLPPKHKQVIELRFYEGKRGNDIADWLGVTPSRVSHMIQDAVEKLRQSLIKEGFA